MDQTELNEQSTGQPDTVNAAQVIAPPPINTNSSAVSPATCASCGAVAGTNGDRLPTHYVFAIGRVEMRFPSIAVEKEFAQATGRANTKGLTDRAAAQAVLTDRANRYIARQICWILTIEGLETYILVPRDPADYDQDRKSVV